MEWYLAAWAVLYTMLVDVMVLSIIAAILTWVARMWVEIVDRLF